jgi:hypothetical protein
MTIPTRFTLFRLIQSHSLHTAVDQSACETRWPFWIAGRVCICKLLEGVIENDLELRGVESILDKGIIGICVPGGVGDI